jgi:gamma-glutamyltranspeptidase
MVLLGILGYDAGLDAQQVAALPRYHHQWLPDLIEAEDDAFDAATVKQLQAMGHKIDLPGNVAAGGRGSSHVWGNLQTVEWDRKATSCLAAATRATRWAAPRSCRHADPVVPAAGRPIAIPKPPDGGVFCFLAII